MNKTIERIIFSLLAIIRRKMSEILTVSRKSHHPHRDPLLKILFSSITNR